MCHTEHILLENSVIVSTNRMWSSISHLADKCSDISINTQGMLAVHSKCIIRYAYSSVHCMEMHYSRFLETKSVYNFLVACEKTLLECSCNIVL